MAFTEQDLKNQQQEIARLADELKRLNSVFEAQKKELGIEGEVTLDDIEMTPALEQALAEAIQAVSHRPVPDPQLVRQVSWDGLCKTYCAYWNH